MHMQIYVIAGTIILGLAIAWGSFRYHGRNKANDKITREATRMMQDDPEGYDHGGREALLREIKPD